MKIIIHIVLLAYLLVVCSPLIASTCVSGTNFTATTNPLCANYYKDIMVRKILSASIFIFPSFRNEPIINNLLARQVYRESYDIQLSLVSHIVSILHLHLEEKTPHDIQTESKK